MNNRMIEKSEWKYYFNLISRSLENQTIELEVAGLDMGDQIEAEWGQFDGISYDANADCIFVHTPLLDHSIRHPQQLMLVEDGDAIVSLNIQDGENSQMIHFHRPIILEKGQPKGAGTSKESHPER